jgi:hypothetical protein
VSRVEGQDVVLWLSRGLDAVEDAALPCPPEDVAPPPDEPIVWLGLELCPLSELIECVLEEVELEMLGELELVGLAGGGAGGELCVVEVEELEGMLGACCAKSAIDTNSRLAVTK